MTVFRPSPKPPSEGSRRAASAGKAVGTGWRSFWKPNMCPSSWSESAPAGGGPNTTVVLTEKAIAFCNDKTETWLDVAFANKTKPKYESTEQLVAKGLFPGAVALPEPSRASQSPAAFECSQVLE